jgi:hypothetical protein
MRWDLLLLLAAAGLGVADKPDKRKKNDPLPNWPSDAPIKLWPRLGRSAVNRQAADRLVRFYLGIDKTKKLHLTPAYLSDNDFPFLRPRKQAIWLAEVKDLQVPPLQKRTTVPAPRAPVLPHLYVAIDAKSGQLLEAFTRPSQPWWRKKEQVVGPAHEKFLRETGQVFKPPSARPKLTLLETLQGIADGPRGQLVVRYVRYSNRVAKNRPALLLFIEGIQMRTRAGKVIGRAMIVGDAQTGTSLYHVSYGNPVR